MLTYHIAVSKVMDWSICGLGNLQSSQLAEMFV